MPGVRSATAPGARTAADAAAGSPRTPARGRATHGAQSAHSGVAEEDRCYPRRWAHSAPSTLPGLRGWRPERGHFARDGSRGVTPSVLLCDCSQVRVDLLLGQAREPFPALAHDADLDVPGLEIHAQHSLEATNCLLDRLGLRHV